MGYLVKNLYFLPLQKPGKLLTISNNNKKAKIFIEKFFPQLALADFNNIIGEVPVTRLRVNSNIIIKEIAKTISRLLNNIVLKLERILKKALKTYGLLIVL